MLKNLLKNKKQQIGMVRLTTQRFLLRPFCIDDAKDMFEWAGDEEVTKYVTWQTHQSVEDSQSVIKEWIEEYKDKSLYNWAIEDIATKKVLGSIGIVIADEIKGVAKIGYVLSRKYWGQGIMPEAAKKVIEHCFFNMNVKTIYAEHIEENAKSGRVMQKSGMRLDSKIARGAKDNQGRLRDVVRYVICNEG